MSETIQRYTPALKVDFLKIKFQCQTQFLDNRVIVEVNFKKIK